MQEVVRSVQEAVLAGFRRVALPAALLAVGVGAGCWPLVFDYDQDFGAAVGIAGPSGVLCSVGADGTPLARCEHVSEVNGVDVNVAALAKGLGEALEVRTDMDDDIGGSLQARAAIYQTFEVVSDVLADGDPVDPLLVADLAGSFREGPVGPTGPSTVTWRVRLWTNGCDATGCGPPNDASLLVDAVLTSSAFIFFEPIQVPVENLAVGDRFGIHAKLVARSDPVVGQRVGADANANVDFVDPDPLPDGPRFRVIRALSP